MKSLSKKSQRGYSLIELSIALAIVGVVIAGSIVGVQAILQSNNVNKTIRQTNTAVNKIIAKLVRDRDYANAYTENLSAKGQEVWDSTDITDGGTPSAAVTHPLASYLYVQPLSVSGASDADKIKLGGLKDNQGYVYTLTGVPTSACTDLAVGLEGLATAMSIENKIPLKKSDKGPVIPVASKLVKSTSDQYNSKTANENCAGPASGAVDSTEIVFLVPRR